jgi:para-nitrobenzyl esterase
MSNEAGFGPNVDDVFLVGMGIELFARGEFNQVPIVAGINGNEGSFFVHSMGLSSQEELSEALNNYGPLWGISDLETLNDLYSVEVYGDAQEAYDQFYSDVSFVCPTRTFMTQSSAYTPVHGYYYTHVPSWIPYYPSLTGWGSYHTSELSFVFGSGDSYLTAEEIALSDAMQEAWTSLAKGDPEIPNLSSWPLFNEAEGGTWVQFDSSEISVVNGVRKTECDFIDQQWLN